MKLSRKGWLAVVAGALVASSVAFAADHSDGTQASADPAADITDLFAWMTDASHMTMIMDLGTNIGSTGKFSNAVKYVFHTSTHSAAGGVAPSAGNPPTLPALTGGTDPEVDVICTFAANGDPSCWVTLGSQVLEYVSGTAANASSTTGIASADGKVKIFAGTRADPFFFNSDGFKAAAASVHAAVPSLIAGNAFNVAGCPKLDSATVSALDGELTTGYDGGTPVDNFAGFDVLSLVVQIDTSVLLQVPADTLVSVWASTNN